MTPAPRPLLLAGLLCGALLGMMLFFTFLMAPLLFRNLGPNGAGPVVSLLFMPYFAVGMLLAAVSGVILLLACRNRLAGACKAAAMSLAAVVALHAVNAFWLLPLSRDLKERPESREDFRRVHGLSFGLNLLAVASALTAAGLMTGAAGRRFPRDASPE